jgi:hypothetical protein
MVTSRTLYKQEWIKSHPGYEVNRRHKFGKIKPMSENRECASFLGRHVAEQVLAGLFDHVEKAPYGNPGWDFVCGKKKRIDCKSSCLRSHHNKRNTHWLFNIKRNDKCEYFLCIAFDNRDDLNPLHVWLIPGELINSKLGLSIPNSEKGLSKWAQYEKPIDKVLTCCGRMKGEL